MRALIRFGKQPRLRFISFSERMEFVPEFYDDGSGLLMNVKF